MITQPFVRSEIDAAALVAAVTAMPWPNTDPIWTLDPFGNWYPKITS
nr:MAG TPA: hypothetical protein [Caudoviricetes sp.]